MRFELLVPYSAVSAKGLRERDMTPAVVKERRISLTTIASIVAALVTIAGPLYPLGLGALERLYEVAYGLDSSTAWYAASLTPIPAASFQVIEIVLQSSTLRLLEILGWFWLIIIFYIVLFKIQIAPSLVTIQTTEASNQQQGVVIVSRAAAQLVPSDDALGPFRTLPGSRPDVSPTMSSVMQRLFSNAHFLTLGGSVLLVLYGTHKVTGGTWVVGAKIVIGLAIGLRAEWVAHAIKVYFSKSSSHPKYIWPHKRLSKLLQKRYHPRQTLQNIGNGLIAYIQSFIRWLQSLYFPGIRKTCAILSTLLILCIFTWLTLVEAIPFLGQQSWTAETNGVRSGVKVFAVSPMTHIGNELETGLDELGFPWQFITFVLILLLLWFVHDLWKLRRRYGSAILTFVNDHLDIAGSCIAFFAFYYVNNGIHVPVWINVITSLGILVSTYLFLSGLFQLRFTSSFLFSLLLNYISLVFFACAVYYTGVSPSDFGRKGIFFDLLPPTAIIGGTKDICGALINHSGGYWYVLSNAHTHSARVLAFRDNVSNPITITSRVPPASMAALACKG